MPEENRKLKQLVAELSLDRTSPQESLRKHSEAPAHGALGPAHAAGCVGQSTGGRELLRKGGY
jgi:hypothetical protein